MRSYGNNAFYYANPGRARKSRVDLKSQLDDLNMDLSAINQEYPAERVWAASWAAFRINGFEYIRDYQQSGKMMNKALMLQLLQNTYEGDSITDDDIATGKEMRTHNSAVTLKAMTQELNNFEKLVGEATLQETVQGNPHFAVIASLCQNWHRELLRREKHRLVATLIDGTYIGQQGDPVDLSDVAVIQSQVSKKYMKYFNIGSYQGNMLSWWSDMQNPENTLLSLSGRIKEHTTWTSEAGPVKMTKINYVRVKNSQNFR